MISGSSLKTALKHQHWPASTCGSHQGIPLGYTTVYGYIQCASCLQLKSHIDVRLFPSCHLFLALSALLKCLFTNVIEISLRMGISKLRKS